MKYILDYLKEYASSPHYPLHMPGHKRARLPFPNPYTIDITEIDGFDNLHHAEGILKEAQERAASLYGSKRCFYLVNGSTCGLLAAICAATSKRGKVIVARNCHKAVYHAIYLNELTAEYIYPQITESGIQGQIRAEQVQEALAGHPDAEAVILTSPTYEGVLSDITAIAEICHTAGVPLIVDEAHGAHLGFGGGFPENAIHQGADAVIMSVHKTLPSFTQTALLHVNSDRISMKRIERYLGIYETSSPSYVFMAGIDECIRIVAEEGTELFAAYREKLNRFYEKTADLKYLHVMHAADLGKEEAFDWDDSKLVIFSGKAGMTGEELHKILLEEYKLQVEMVSGYYVLGMTSLMDSEEGLDRLSTALHEIDASVAKKKNDQTCENTDIQANTKEENKTGQCINNSDIRSNITDSEEKMHDFLKKIYRKQECQLPLYEAQDAKYREVPFTEAVGRISADTIYLYPPGIPMIVPGEEITAELIDNIMECLAMGLLVEGTANISKKTVNIVYF